MGTGLGRRHTAAGRAVEHLVEQQRRDAEFLRRQRSNQPLRVEGDEMNAGGWYKRAGKTPPSTPLDQEWEEIARALLAS